MSHHSWSFCWSTPPPVNQSDCLKRDKRVHERVIDETCPEPLYPSTWQSLESQAFSNTSQIPPMSRGQPMGEKKLVNSKERREKTYRFMCVREREREREWTPAHFCSVFFHQFLIWQWWRSWRIDRMRAWVRCPCVWREVHQRQELSSHSLKISQDLKHNNNRTKSIHMHTH